MWVKFRISLKICGCKNQASYIDISMIRYAMRCGIRYGTLETYKALAVDVSLQRKPICCVNKNSIALYMSLSKRDHEGKGKV